MRELRMLKLKEYFVSFIYIIQNLSGASEEVAPAREYFDF